MDVAGTNSRSAALVSGLRVDCPGQLTVAFPSFLKSPFKLRAPFFLLSGFNKGAHKQKGQKGRCTVLGA